VRVAGNAWSQAVLQFASTGDFNRGGASREFADFLQKAVVLPSLDATRHAGMAGTFPPSQMGRVQAAIMRQGIQATTFGVFAASGFPVYEMTEQDGAQLEEWCVGDSVSLEAPTLHMCFYVAWPTSERLSFFWGEKDEAPGDGEHREYVDGVFVCQAGDGGILLVFTTKLRDGTPLLTPGPQATVEALNGRSLRESFGLAADRADSFSSMAKGMTAANQALKEALEEQASEAEALARAARHRIAGAIAYVQQHGNALEAPVQREEMPITGYGKTHPPKSHFEAMAMSLDQGVLPVTRMVLTADWLDSLPEVAPREQTTEEKAKLVRLAMGAVERVAGKIEHAEAGDPQEWVEPVERDLLQEVLLGDNEVLLLLLEQLRRRPVKVPLFITTLGAMGEQVAARMRESVAALWGQDAEKIDAWRAAVMESMSALHAHVADMPRPYRIVGIMSSHPEGPEQRCKLTIMCERPAQSLSGSFVWDCIECTHKDPLAMLVVASEGLDLGALGTEKGSGERQLHPLFRYHPERFRSTRKYASEALEHLDRFRAAAAAGKVARERVNDAYLGAMNSVIGMLISELNQENMRQPMRQRAHAGQEAMSQAVNAEINLLTIISAWLQYGRQIFDFPKRMMDMFAMTDIDEIPCEKVKLPHHVQYVHFGPREDIEIEAGWLVDGAYIESMADGGWQVCVTSVPRNPDDAYGWTARPEPIFVQVFGASSMGMSLGEAVDFSLADKLAELREKAAEGDGEITEELGRKFAEEGLEMPAGIKIVKIFAKSAESETAMLMRRLPAYKKALRLVVNAMCYVTAYPDDVKDAFPSGAPDRILKTASLRIGSKEQKKALSKLEQLGFRAIHFCGQALLAKLGGEEGWSRGAGWTRGHWRNQAWGPKHSLRRLQWIMPFRTGVDDGNPEFGHLYMVT
jgi:hypothetical protein